ncbi:MAG TPA: sulfite exporter TauE/SafE family protein [Solirubrobacteraceae bacterium]|nr:sulfite exporter TauE/SafE family protein [Solirubrobacteraceae bacterium]
MIAALAFGLAIGLAVGMVGGGGAVLAVPALVYAVGLGVHEATTASLAVVSLGAATGAVGQARRGAVCWSSAAWFALAAAAGSVAGTLANRALGGELLLLAFSGVMLAAARSTWTRAGSAMAKGRGCPRARARVLVPIGLGVGALTGLVGVGGGFVVVPTLAIGLSFGMREAMATSIVVVAVVSLCGLAAHLAAGGRLDVPVTLAMGGAAMAGACAGPALAAGVSTEALARGFALLVVLVALGVAGATVAGASV